MICSVLGRAWWYRAAKWPTPSGGGSGLSRGRFQPALAAQKKIVPAPMVTEGVEPSIALRMRFRAASVSVALYLSDFRDHASQASSGVAAESAVAGVAKPDPVVVMDLIARIGDCLHS